MPVHFAFFSVEIIEVLRHQTQPIILSSEQILDEIKRYPFIQQHPIEGFTFHEEVRAYLLLRLYRQNPDRYRSLHLELAKFFNKRVSLDTYRKNRRVYEIEEAYHMLGVDEARGLEIVHSVFFESEQR